MTSIRSIIKRCGRVGHYRIDKDGSIFVHKVEPFIMDDEWVCDDNAQHAGKISPTDRESWPDGYKSWDEVWIMFCAYLGANGQYYKGGLKNA